MRSRRRVVAWAGVTLVVVAGLVLLPPVRTRLAALSTVLEALGTRVPRPFAPRVDPVDTMVNGVTGRLYSPRAGLAAILLVPGATPAGTRDPRVDQVAHALSRAGREVFVPELDLYQERFTTADLERIRDAIRGLASRSGEPVTVAGFSYGGSFALVAAGRSDVADSLRRIGVMGAYFDLVGVVQAVTTGRSVVAGDTIEWQGNPLARDFLNARVAGLLDDPGRSQLIGALAAADPSTLGDDARAAYELLTNREPGRTHALAKDLPPELGSIMETFSPASVADRITVPVLAMHSTDDPLVPYGELRRMEEGMPLVDAVTVSLFEHVDFDGSSVREWGQILPEMAKVWTFTTWLLAG